MKLQAWQKAESQQVCIRLPSAVSSALSMCEIQQEYRHCVSSAARIRWPWASTPVPLLRSQPCQADRKPGPPQGSLRTLIQCLIWPRIWR